MYVNTSRQSARPIIRTAMNPHRRHKKRPTVTTVNPVAFLSVSVVLGLLCIVCVFYLALDGEQQYQQQQQQQQNKQITVSNVSSNSNNNNAAAGGGSERVRGDDDKRSATIILQRLRHDFVQRYGDELAPMLLQRGIVSYGNITETAKRMVRTVASEEKRPFVMAFAGYSVTVGRGNYFTQSFPFVMERILRDPMKDVLGIDLVVRNAAIGGIPSFPYGWCLAHFLGKDADVVSWDYGMNEGRGAAILESYIRHSLTTLPNRPMFLMLDTNKERSHVLDQYSKLHLLADAIRVGRAADTVLLDGIDPTTMEHPPPGLQGWNDFGAPRGCPGKAKWHPKKMEHELIGWMIAMHMIRAIELAHSIMQQDGWREIYGTDMDDDDANAKLPLSFPPPMNSPPSTNDESVTELLYGHLQDDGHYFMKNISCRTSFLPAVDHDLVLPSIVVSGLSEGTTDMDRMMEERSDDVYHKGWVLDVSKVERETKRKVDRCGGLGYIDMKVALYGIPQSGTLRLWLPSSSSQQRRTTVHGDDSDGDARQFFDSLIICEANESRDKEACQLNEDIHFVVGGEDVPSDAVALVAGAGEYLKRKTCISVRIPPSAKVTRLGNVETVNGGALTDKDKRRLSGSLADDATTDDDAVGLTVDITARPRVSRQQGACCVSHIVWEHH